MEKSRLELLSERLIECFSKFGDKQINSKSATCFKDVGGEEFADLREVINVIRTYVLGQSLDKLQRSIWEKRVDPKEAYKRINSLTKELAGIKTNIK